MNSERIKQMQDSAIEDINKEAEKYPDIKILLDDYNTLKNQKSWTQDFLEGYLSCISDLKYIKKMNITREQRDAAAEVVRLYHEQIIEERRQRNPLFGDTVRCLNGCLGRYIGIGQALFYESDSDGEINRDLVEMESDCGNPLNLPLPSDADLIDFLRQSVTWEPKLK